jgi:hypothetical protein
MAMDIYFDYTKKLKTSNPVKLPKQDKEAENLYQYIVDGQECVNIKNSENTVNSEKKNTIKKDPDFSTY